MIAYFSMEAALAPEIPTYAGGLGVLAGDTLRAAADLRLPLVGVTLVHRAGYFRQRLDPDGSQTEEPDPWSPQDCGLEDVGHRVRIELRGRDVAIRAWRHLVGGVSGGEVQVYLLDTALPENAPEDRALSDRLYGGDDGERLAQEAVLGLGGVALLRALGRPVGVYHLNEGHSALLALALLESALDRIDADRPDAADSPEALDAAVEAVQSQCVFTTHTPVPAGHDRFPGELVGQLLGGRRASLLARLGFGDELNMTRLALHLSRYVNGVAMSHRHVTRDMFPGYSVDSITNGVHAPTWTAPAFRALFDRHIPEWRRDSFNLRYAVGIPLDEIRAAHEQAKGALLDEVARRAGVTLDPAALTLGFARRATAYKRASLLFTDPQRLRRIVRAAGPMQLLFAGKAHPRDQGGKDLIRRVVEVARELGDEPRVLYLQDYDMRLAALMVAGVDVWLNTPQPPQEASGTSGMKAALNGVPSLSVLDGWWVEGHLEGVTGWAIGEDSAPGEDTSGTDAASLYDKLERDVLPSFYDQPERFARIMRSAIAINGSFFNSQRMIMQYAAGAYASPAE